MNRLTLKVKQNCDGNVCPMPLKFIISTIQGLKLVNYDEKSEFVEFEYDAAIISKESIVAKLKEKKYQIVD